jgi:pyruvate/2-oxoglutarate dehydrogenase complex dihydrolipoamide dehydrogenase (E3) component
MPTPRARGARSRGRSGELVILIYRYLGVAARGRGAPEPEVRAAGRWELERDPYLLETSVPGIFACGDVRRGPVKRVAAAVGEDSMAIAFVHQYLKDA